jgi:DNA-binding MarR family transcriptional regulator
MPKARASTTAAGSAPAVPTAEAVQSWLAVVRAYNLCDAALAHRLAPLHISLPEHEVLINLRREPGLPQQTLARRCFVAKSGVSMLVTRMADAGLLRREADPGDARVKRLHLTARGQALAVKAQAVQDSVVLAMVAGASAADLATVTNAMYQASEALEGILAADP